MLNCSRCQQRSRSELVRSKQAHQIAMMMCQDHHVPLIPMDSFVHSTCFIFNANACSMQQMITKINWISFKNLFVCVFVSKLAQCFCKCNIPHRVAVEEPMTAPVLKASSSTGEHFHSSDTIFCDTDPYRNCHFKIVFPCIAKLFQAWNSARGLSSQGSWCLGTDIFPLFLVTEWQNYVFHELCSPRCHKSLDPQQVWMLSIEKLNWTKANAAIGSLNPYDFGWNCIFSCNQRLFLGWGWVVGRRLKYPQVPVRFTGDAEGRLCRCHSIFY
jgi:hypothetical protein